MKKLLFMLIAAVSLTLVSCSVESKAERYYDKIQAATEDGDFDEANKIEEEFDEWLDGLSREDRKKAKKVFEEKAMESIKQATENAKDLMKDVKEMTSDAKDITDDVKEMTDDVDDMIDD